MPSSKLSATLLASFMALMHAPQILAQIVLQDRRLQGHVGLTNTTLTPPEIVLSTVAPPLRAESAGRVDALENSGPLFDDGGPTSRRAYEVVCEAWGGDYWLSVDARFGGSVPQESYRFGYALNRGGAPGYPNFVDAFLPFLQRVTTSDPDPLPSVDLFECAGQIEVNFVETDPARPGFYRPTTLPVSAGIYVHPRANPGAPAPWLFADEYLTGYMDKGPQARGSLATGATRAMLWVRASAQLPPREGPEVSYEVHVRYRIPCTLPNPACPSATGFALIDSWFSGRVGSLGDLDGYLEQGRAAEPGLVVPCDAPEPLKLYVLVAPCMTPCPAPTAAMEGCASLIGEHEITSSAHGAPQDTRVKFDWGHGSVSQGPLSNVGETVPAPPSSGWLEHYEPADSEGSYNLGGIPTPEDGRFELTTTLQATTGAKPWLQTFEAFESWWFAPPPGTTGPGPDLCLVPGIYRGTITLRDANGGRAASGGLRALVEADSTIVGLGDRQNGFINIPWFAHRDHRGGAYDGSTGTWLIPHENVFAASRYQPVRWTERVLEQKFENASPDPARWMKGGVRTVFLQPTNEVLWNAWDWVSPSSGGTWTGPLMPDTQVAPRESRVVPASLDLCYAKLRVQIRSTTVRFFLPTITAGSGSFSDDRGTPSTADDIRYDATIGNAWSGTPHTFEEAATEGVVNLVLPAGHWEDVAGVIRTVLDPVTHRVGMTELTEVDLDLGCGESCTLAENPQGGVPLAMLCLEPILLCNDPGVLALRVPLSGSLFHQEAIVAAWWRINGGAPIPFDPATAGITCTALPCTDPVSVTVLAGAADFHACLNRIELSFQDALGLVVSGFLDTVIDTAPPTLSLPNGAPLPCGGRQFVCEGDDIPYPVVSDNCSSLDDVDSRLVLMDDRPASFPDGETRVTYRAIDGCGNETRCELTIVVGGEGETTIDCPPPLVLECPDAGGVDHDDPRILAWLRSVVVEVTCGASPLALDDAPGFLPSGCGAGRSTTVTFWTTDASGARIECTSTVTVRDTTEPRLIVPAPITLECTSPGGVPSDDLRLVAWLAAAQAEDDCGTVELRDDAPASFPRGCTPGTTTLVHWRATDACGLFVDGESSVTVVDTRPPTLIVPPPIVLECSTRGGVAGDAPDLLAWLALASAADDCGPAHLTHDAPPLLPSGCEPGLMTTIHFVARDECGNEASDTSTITVVDTQPPEFDGAPRLGLGAALIWPPQHGYVQLDFSMLDVRVRDACGDVRLSFAGCLSSQPEDNQGDENAGDGGDGRSACDCAVSPDGARVVMRAERDGGCAPLGRRYSIVVRAVDECGNAADSPPFFVCVPHDHRDVERDAIVLRANPSSHQNDDACAQGFLNGSYPAATGHGGATACGAGCP